MELTPIQQQGLEVAIERYKNKQKYVCIAGYAGTGKTTVVKFIISALRIYPDAVAYVAFTGKAAEVLRSKGNPNATTAHKLLYYSHKQADGTFVHRKKPRLEHNYKIIVVDEVSMLPKDMWELLLSYNIFVIALGDPFQIPAINPDQDNHVLDKPHVFFKEVHRQAQDSEIIKLSMAIREGKPIIPYDGKEVKIYYKDEVSPELYNGMLNWADQVLCATNNTRQNINTLVRANKGFVGDPQKGDKLISLSNHWNINDMDGENALTNGTIGYLGDNHISKIHYPVRNSDFPKQVPLLEGQFVSETGADFGYLMLDYNFLTKGIKFLTEKQENVLRAMKKLETSIPLDFDYAYAITTHKSQGSQWDKVLVIEEGFPFEDLEHRRHLYTAVTRASKKLVLLLNKRNVYKKI